MPRPEKVAAVTDIKERLESARAVFLAEYAGLSVKAQQALRRGLRDSEAEFKVVKMTLARRAAMELDLAELDELLVGPTALAFASGDPVTAAKALTDFASSNDRLKIKGGLLGAEFLPPEKITELAKIEPREVLLGKIAGAAKAPLANMAGLMAAFTRNAASMFKQLLDRIEGEGPAAAAPAEPEAGDEPAPETEAAAEPEPEAAEPEPEAEADEPEAAEPEPEAEADEPEAAEAAADEPEPAADDATTGDAEAAAESVAESTDEEPTKES